ncbi:MAG: signal peptidase II [Candidatus Ratteibacteria bacterium]|nr:signal peptidase II [Candidatus Ratteibacteria bacterium]
MPKLSTDRGAVITTAALILLFDQILKFLFYNKALIKENIALIKGVLYIVPASQNPGIAFGLLQGYGRFFAIPVFIIISLIVFLYLKPNCKKPILQWGLLLILAGALSNLIDRIIHGWVIDYLLLNKFPYSFNIADTSILTGVGLIIIDIVKCKKQILK